MPADQQLRGHGVVIRDSLDNGGGYGGGGLIDGGFGEVEFLRTGGLACYSTYTDCRGD